MQVGLQFLQLLALFSSVLPWPWAYARSEGHLLAHALSLYQVLAKQHEIARQHVLGLSQHINYKWFCIGLQRSPQEICIRAIERMWHHLQESFCTNLA